jgi:hypothetical protein
MTAAAVLFQRRCGTNAIAEQILCITHAVTDRDGAFREDVAILGARPSQAIGSSGDIAGH